MEIAGRVPATLAGAVGALAAGIGATVTQSFAVSGLAWAALAAVSCSLMLDSLGLQVVGILLILLAVSGAGVALIGQWWLALAFVLVLTSGVVMAWKGRDWAKNSKRPKLHRNMWRDFDDGEDPTA